MFNSTTVMDLIEANSEQILPILLPEICAVSNEHWNPSIKSLQAGLLKQLSCMFPKLVSELKSKSEDNMQM